MTPDEKHAHARSFPIHVGVDTAKTFHVLVAQGPDGRRSPPCKVLVDRAGFAATDAHLRALFPRHTPAQMLVGLEFAGHHGFTFAHFLDQLGVPVVSVLPAHTKRWKEVAHNQPLKTDAKDAATITDLLGQGHFVSFPFLAPAYAELRSLAAGRERLCLLRRGALTQLRSLLQVVFPEFEALFPQLTKKTPLALLRAFPTPDDLLRASKAKVLRVLHTASRGHLGAETYAELLAAARGTLALPGAQGRLRQEIGLILERIALFEAQIRALEAAMIEALAPLPETPCLLSIPKVAPVTAAVFLGSIGDPQAYESGAQILRVAGLSLIERSSGILRGTKRISKRGRPLLRQAAYMFAVRSITQDGLFRAEYDALCARNGGQKMKAVVAVMRSGLRLMYSVARDRRRFTAEVPDWRVRPPREAAIA
jgi:transposase